MQQERLDRFEAWLVHHKGKQLIGKYGFTKSDLEDVKQELALDLLERLKTFDPTRAQRHTFVAMVVEHRIAAIIEHRTAAMRDLSREAFSLNETIRDPDGEVVQRVQMLTDEAHPAAPDGQERLHLAADVRTVVASLPPRLQALCYSLRTKSPAEVARERGVPRTTLYGDIRRLAEAFELAGLRIYLGGK